MCYGTSENPTTGSNKTVVSGSGIGEFSADLSGLSPETKYYARAYATNTEGTAYGNEVDFTTATAAYDFPDTNFRTYLLENFDSDKSGKLSESEVLKVTKIECYEKDIVSLQGIEYFRNLSYLNCSDNPLASLDVTKCAKLDTLVCHVNQLTTLDVTKCTKLTGLECSGNQLTTLDISKCTALDFLYCTGNQFTTLDVTKCTALDFLYYDRNQLIALDVTKCTKLYWFHCMENQLTALDVSQCAALTQLDCRNNPALATLKIKNGTCSYRNYSGTLITSDSDITWVP